MPNTSLTNTALKALDEVAFQLDALGISSGLTRHNLAALAFSTQKRIEGEKDSINVKILTTKYKMEQIAQTAEEAAKCGIGLMLLPVTYPITRIRSA